MKKVIKYESKFGNLYDTEEECIYKENKEEVRILKNNAYKELDKVLRNSVTINGLSLEFQNSITLFVVNSLTPNSKGYKAINKYFDIIKKLT